MNPNNYNTMLKSLEDEQECYIYKRDEYEVNETDGIPKLNDNTGLTMGSGYFKK